MASVDNSGEVARRFALNVREALAGRSLRDAEKITGVDHSTIQAILQGKTWPDLDTIAKLERGFGVVLWPGLASAGE
jgi:transcriptional regulator with XRE-family HTH domain